MADQNPVETFKAVTGADDQTASFYLSAANNNLAQAVQAYFDSVKPSSPAATQAAPQQPQQPSQPMGRRLGSGNASEPVPLAQSVAPAQKKAPVKQQPQKFKSLLDMQKGDDDDDDDEHNRYFAGGSKGSGELIIGGKKNSEDDDLTSKIFKKAIEQGAAPPPSRQQPDKNANTFVGKGNRLGSGEALPQQQQQQQPNQSQQQPNDDAMNDEEEKPRNITLTFYLDGFTIDDGELKKFDDPANKHILEAITQGFVPAEIAGNAKAVDVALVKKNEKYSPPPKVFKAFGGSGKALGATPSTPVQSTPAVSTTAAAQSYSCDLNKPHTTLQLRLHDGTRLVAKFNLTDTVQTICNFVAASCPGLNRQFVLATTFPKKELVDMNQTIEQAKLQNAALVQTLK